MEFNGTISFEIEKRDMAKKINLGHLSIITTMCTCTARNMERIIFSLEKHFLSLNWDD